VFLIKRDPEKMGHGALHPWTILLILIRISNGF